MPAVLPDVDVAAIRHFCEQRVPQHAGDGVRVEAEGDARSVTIVERRAPWHEDFGPEWTALAVARLRFTATTGCWSLYWRDRNERWQKYDGTPPTPDVRALLNEVDRDPTGIFWG